MVCVSIAVVDNPIAVSYSVYTLQGTPCPEGIARESESTTKTLNTIPYFYLKQVSFFKLILLILFTFVLHYFLLLFCFKNNVPHSYNLLDILWTEIKVVKSQTNKSQLR